MRAHRPPLTLLASGALLAAFALASTPPSGAEPEPGPPEPGAQSEAFVSCGPLAADFQVPGATWLVRVTVRGAEGGDGMAEGSLTPTPGGLGGVGSATVSVTAFEHLDVYVGCAGGDVAVASSTGGPGGAGRGPGGDGGDNGFGNPPAGGGGGASAVLRSSQGLVVAGGGGGGGAASSTAHPVGGGAGGGVGRAGHDGVESTAGCAGEGATPAAVGAGGDGPVADGAAGSGSTGGGGADGGSGEFAGGGGGGGRFGGGGAGTSGVTSGCGGGGGGSGYAIASAFQPEGADGLRSGDGEVIIDWPVSVFEDVDTDHAFFEEISWMASRSISTGYADGTHRPDDRVSRAAMAAFMYRLAGEPAVVLPPASPFADVPRSHPFYDEIVWVADVGVAKGYADGGFHPAASVTRQAMSAFLYRLAGEPAFTAPGTPSFGDVPVGAPFYDEIEWMADEQISTGYPDGTYRPVDPVTRQAMSAFLFRLAFGPGVGV